ncbi:MAG TPA: mannonate dehydratase [Rhodothermales bacterium]|nr:mannonate dehydratase [Rhodothermales bacterium]
MKLGLGLYRDSLTDDNYRFARQAGVTHLVVHLTSYFAGKSPVLTSGDADRGWGVTRGHGKLWTVDVLAGIKREIEAHGLTWAAVENFDPAHWHDVLLDGSRRDEQVEDVKRMIHAVGEVGIPVIGYYFSLAGVWGWTRGPFGRGEAVSVRYDQNAIDKDRPIPNGMVWNMIYDEDAPPGIVLPVTEAQLWDRFRRFLAEVLPVAEEAGVTLALHPDDPPVDTLRGTARLVTRPEAYQRVLDLVPSPSNALEFCLGTLQEMPRAGPESWDVFDAIRHYGRQRKIAYVHFRNVKGKVPFYQEVFVDEGDLDMPRALRALRDVGFDGVLIPDHTPEMRCAAPWHAGMAYALGYMRAAIRLVQETA